MRNRLLIGLLFFSLFGWGQVPDTETFSLQDVVTAVSPSSNDQVACFLEAIPEYYNPTYNNDLYAPISSLLRFRDYGAHNALGFETYVAPDDFDPDAQPVNIYEVFKDYYKVNHDAKWIYSVTDATTKTKPTSGTSYYYGYELGGIEYESPLSLGDSVMWIAGATKKWVITNHTSASSIRADVPGYNTLQNQGAEWLYCGDLIYSVLTSSGSAGNYSDIKYVHIHNLENITEYFYGCHRNAKLEGTLYISPTVTTIEIGGHVPGAFEANVGITNVVFHENITVLGWRTFNSCTGLTALNLPNSLTTISPYCFNNCNGLNGTVTFPTTLTSIGLSAFYGCTKLDILDFSEGLITIGQTAFQNCTDLDCPLTFPSTLTTIGYGAFLGCTGLNCTLTIPSTILTIGEAAFGNTNFTDIDESNTNYLVYDSVLYQLSPDTLALHSVKSATDSLEFLANTELIGDYCCYNNLRTDTLVIPDNVTRVGDYAFNNCDGFNFLDLGSALSNLTLIESGAFYSWQGVYGVTLTVPSSVITVLGNCFAYSNWGGLVLNEGLETIGDQAFGSLLQISTQDLIIPNTVKTIGLSAFFNTPFGGNLTLGNSLTSIGMFAFAGCYITDTLNIPSNVSSIVVGAFRDNNLDSITSDAVKFPVYDNVLYDESVSGQIKAHTGARLHSGTLTFKSGITSILSYCLNNNTGRTGTLGVPYTVTSIEGSSLQGCTGFTSATIGDCTNGSSLATIGEGAFSWCTSIASWEIYDPTAATCATGSFGNYAKPLYVQTDATGYNITPATVAAPWTNTAIFSAVNYTLCP